MCKIIKTQIECNLLHGTKRKGRLSLGFHNDTLMYMPACRKARYTFNNLIQIIRSDVQFIGIKKNRLTFYKVFIKKNKESAHEVRIPGIDRTHFIHFKMRSQIK